MLPARRSYEVNGNINQPLGGTWIARGNVDYFSDIEVQQTYHTNIYDASRSQRSVNAGLTGTLGQLTLNATYRRNEIFSGTSNTTVYGGAPQVQITRGEQPLFGLPLYFGVSGEFVRVQREVHRRTGVTDSNLTRLDATPTLRFPFTQLRWLTREHVAVAARDVVVAEPRGGDQRIRRRRHLAALRAALRPRGRAGAQPGVRHAGLRVRRAAQAHHRAVRGHPPRHEGGQLRRDHLQSTVPTRSWAAPPASPTG